jgi:hypothetical protein
VVCGEHGVADVLLNVMLFLPLGAVLKLAGEQLRRVFLASALLSCAVECAQLFIPGRDSSLGDIRSNPTGAVAGFALASGIGRSIRTTGSTRALGVTAAGLAVALIAATAYLLQPDWPTSDYYGQWTPRLGHLEPYRGRMPQAMLGASVAPTRASRELPASADAVSCRRVTPH